MKTTKYPEKFTWQDYRVESPEERDRVIEALLRAMTPEEKFGLLSGAEEPKDKGKIGNAGYQWGVPRLGVPEAVMFDGPAGITGVVETTGLPQPTLLGCTWDDALAYAFGKVAGEECAACSGNFLLAPQVDVIRSPHFGRNKDMKSEDSYMAARMAVQETLGVQDGGAVATLKHFAAANASGPSPYRMPNQIVDEQTLHETYLRTFDAAIHEGKAGSVMNAYSKVNGKYCSANRGLLVDVLRDQWGYEGSVISDWGSVNEFTLNKGMDIEMPYPGFNSPDRIQKNIDRGRMDDARVDDAVRNVLRGMASVGLLGLVQLDADGEVMEEPDRKRPIQMEWHYDSDVADGMLERHAAVAAKIVREGIVLLKNENGALPLKKERVGSIALIGTGAVYPVCGQDQERSYGRLERMLSGKAALEELTGEPFPAHAGIDYVGVPIPADALWQDAACTKSGLIRSYGILDEDRDKVAEERGPGGAGGAFRGAILTDEDGEPVDTGLAHYFSAAQRQPRPEDKPAGTFCRYDKQIDFTCGTDENGRIVKNYRNAANGSAFTEEEIYTWKGFLKAPETGEYSLMLQCIGGQASFFIQTEDGWKLVGQNRMREGAQWPWDSTICTPEGMGITASKLNLEAGKAYPIVVHCRQCILDKDLQIRLAWRTPSIDTDNYRSAMDAAAKADTVIYFACDTVVGTGAKGGPHRDETDIGLSQEQTKLLLDTADAMKPDAKLIVVAQTANARAIGSWADRADAIVTTYMPGQEGSRVLAEILTGMTNPTGKLNQSWPARNEDTPLSDTPWHVAQRLVGVSDGDEVTLRMDEGIFTGYRWHDRYGVAPLFPFGHGLSYTRFAYSDVSVEAVDIGSDFGGTWTVRCKVTNTGEREGDEIVQLYLGRAEVPDSIQMAEKQLVGYVRLNSIAPGETKEAVMTIDPKMLCYWDSERPLQTRSDGTKDKWVRTSGQRAIYIGASSADIRLESVITV